MPASPLALAAKEATRELELSWASEEERAAELTATERYARDPFALMDDGLVWIWSKFERRVVRLDPFPTQRELIEAWIDCEHLAKTGQLRFRNVVDEKSRQMGETWIVAEVLLWALHFHTVSLFAHHYRAAEVDDGGERSTWKSLYGKVRYMDRRLGSSNGLVQPSARARVPGLGKLSFRPRAGGDPAKIENQRREAVCYSGEQSTDPGRGGTFDAAVIDETAFVPWGEKVHSSLDEACPEGKLYLSTPQGDDNVHARLIDERPQGWRVLRHHWSEHPLYREGIHVAGLEAREQASPEMAAAAKACPLCAGTRAEIAWDPQNPRSHRYPGRLTSPWYDARVIGKTDEQVAQELDIDRSRALSGRVYSEFEPERHVVAEGIPLATGLDGMGIELGWDFGITTAIVICQDLPDSYRVVGEVELVDQPGETPIPEKVVAALRATLLEIGYEERLLTKNWLQRIYAIGDPGGHSPSMDTGRPFVDAYARLGLRIGKPPPLYTRRVETNVLAVKRLLLGSPKPLRISGPACPRFIEHMRNNRWTTDRLGKRRVSATDVPLLLNDAHNHMMRAFAYLVVAKFPPPLDHDPTEFEEQPSTERKLDGILEPSIRYGMSL